MGKMQRRKGHNFERELAVLLREVFGPDVRRGLGQARAAGEVPDVDTPGPWWVEAKRMRRCNPVKALAQAYRAVLDHQATHKKLRRAGPPPRSVPVAICKNDQEPITVTMYLDDWMPMLAAFVREQEREKSNPLRLAGLPPGAE